MLRASGRTLRAYMAHADEASVLLPVQPTVQSGRRRPGMCDPPRAATSAWSRGRCTRSFGDGGSPRRARTSEAVRRGLSDRGRGGRLRGDHLAAGLGGDEDDGVAAGGAGGPAGGWSDVDQLRDELLHDHDARHGCSRCAWGTGEVEIEATPESYTWHWGDGSEAEPTDEPGAEHEDGEPHEVFHVYTDAGVTVRPSVDVTYRGRYRIEGGCGSRSPRPSRSRATRWRWRSCRRGCSSSAEDGNTLARGSRRGDAAAEGASTWVSG